MELATGAMASLAPKLGELLMEEYVAQKGLKPEIESLSRELVAMDAALADASRAPPDQLTEVHRFWARQVRELSYDMEDAVDDFALRVAGRESAGATTDASMLKNMVGKVTAAARKVKDRHRISDRVKDIKKLSDELAELRAKYTVRGVGADLAASAGIDPRVLNLYRKDSDLVGVEGSRDKVIRMLTGTRGRHGEASDQSLRIVSIVGVGGLGKTTLAKTVHDKLKKSFGCSAFISVGRTPDMARIFEKMLVELDHEKQYNGVDMARWDADQFCMELHGFLQHKRYLFVVDDIWDKGSWEAIKYALKDNNCGSRIIMTTRNLDVVTKAEEVYRLKPLSNVSSKELFLKRIQSHEGEYLDDLSDEVSSKIIDKCCGVPLAIIAIASLMVDRPREDWLKVYDSIGFGNEDNAKKILSYSYYDLPSYLKPCLLYLGIFPEDFVVDTKAVIWMWIGEGFVHLEEHCSLFEVGERYFKELVNRSMIEPAGPNIDGLVPQSFRIHDIVFDLIRELVRGENFITILGSRGQHASSSDSSRREKKTSMPHSGSKVRRLAVPNHHVQHIPEDTMDAQVLRSLIIAGSKIESMAPLDSFRVCRVLYIEDSYVPASLLKHLGKLLHLRYLELSGTPVDELPREIGHLKSLQALVLARNNCLDELPPAVCSLTHLMCLRANGFERLPADRMGSLTSLEELQLKSVVGRSATEDLVVELGKLTRLRVVGISFSEELEESLQRALVQSLCNLREVQELVLYFESRSQLCATSIWEGWEPPSKLRRLLIEGIRFWRPPGWINSSRLPRLCCLYLRVYLVEVQDLDNLVRLPELYYLDLQGWSWPPGYTVGASGFKNLRSGCVGTALRFQAGAAPRLEVLQFGVYAGHRSFAVDGVPLEQFPTKDVIGDLDFGLDNLPSLELVAVVVDCWGAGTAEVQEMEVVRRAMKDHPNRPDIMMQLVRQENMLSVERLEALRIEELISVPALKDKPDLSFIVLLRCYRRLQEAVFSIDCAGASMREVEKVEAAFRLAAKAHRNHPTIQLIRINTDKMIAPDRSNTEMEDRDDSLDNSLSKLQLRN